MFVAKMERKNTMGPTVRLARKKSSVLACVRRNATLPITAMITR